jgi:O-antigen ligase
MSSAVRAAAVIAVVAVATWGEGGASAPSLLAQHLVLAAVVAAAALAAPSPGVPSRGPAAAWMVFAALAAAGAAVAPYAYAAWLVLVDLLAFGAVVWLAAGVPAAVGRALPPALAVLASLHGLAAVVQRLGGDPRPASSFLNTNHLAAWLAAAAIVSAGAAVDGGARRLPRAAYGAACALALAGIFVTGSRGAVAGLAVGAAVLVAMELEGRPAQTRRRILGVAALVVVATTSGVALRFATDSDPYRFLRTRIWSASLSAAIESPWKGTGPGQFAAAAPNLNFPVEFTPLRYERTFRTPHSDLLRSVCEFGWPAGIAALLAAALLALETVRERRRSSAGTRAAFAALCALAAQGLVDDLSTRPALVLLAAALVGVVAARPRAGAVGERRSFAALAAAFGIVLALGVGEAAGFAAWRDVHDLPPGRLDASRLARLRRGLRWNPMQPDYWKRLADHAVGDGRAWRIEDYSAAREAAEHARRLQPADAVYAREEARVEAAACVSILPFESTRRRAQRLYDEAEDLARTDATIPLEASAFLYQAGDPAGARREAERALRIEPRAATPRLSLARAILEEEGPQGTARARRLLDEAASLALRSDERATSAYDAALRSVDPAVVASLRSRLDAAADR